LKELETSLVAAPNSAVIQQRHVPAPPEKSPLFVTHFTALEALKIPHAEVVKFEPSTDVDAEFTNDEPPDGAEK
jgi:hypothetical protein